MTHSLFNKFRGSSACRTTCPAVQLAREVLSERADGVRSMWEEEGIGGFGLGAYLCIIILVETKHIYSLIFKNG